MYIKNCCYIKKLLYIIFFFSSDHIIIVKPTKYKQGETVKNNGTKDYKNMSKERLLSTYDTINRITENLSRNGLNKIAKMQNLSLNELEKNRKNE